MSPLRTSAQTQSEINDHDWGTIQFFAGTTISGTRGISGARVTINANTANTRHSHPTCDEILYLLKGQLTHYVGKDAYPMQAGDSIAIPAGVPHYAINTADENADMIVIYSNGQRDFKLEPLP